MPTRRHAAVAAALALFIGACGSSAPDDGGTAGAGGFSGSAGSSGGAGTGGGGVDCATVVAEVQGSSGCVLQMTGPANCAELDFGPTGWVEFAWTTNGTFCEGPHTFLIGGHPSSTWDQDNGKMWSLSSTDGQEFAMGSASSYSMVRNMGGYVRLRREELDGISTTTGQYHWLVSGFYDVSNGGSTTGTRTFTVKP